MGLRFPGLWRFTPPVDGHFINSSIPDSMVWELKDVIEKIATQADRWPILEHFKNYFGVAFKSSSESWAESDLLSAMQSEANNAPVFIESFVNACDALRQQQNHLYVPETSFLNAVLVKNNIGYELRSGELVAREINQASISVTVSTPNIAEKTKNVVDDSLDRSEQLLLEGRAREAVQEILWLLETVVTAFRGVETESGKVEGKYFNKIVQELKKQKQGATLEQVLDWVLKMHGYLSSPQGGGVRHGIDLKEGISLDLHEARLFCNLTRSYISFLLAEYESITLNK